MFDLDRLVNNLDIETIIRESAEHYFRESVKVSKSAIRYVASCSADDLDSDYETKSEKTVFAAGAVLNGFGLFAGRLNTKQSTEVYVEDNETEASELDDKKLSALEKNVYTKHRNKRLSYDDLPTFVMIAADEYSEVNDLFERYLAKYGYTAAEVCEQCSVSPATFSRIRHVDVDYNPINKYKILRICICLKMTFEETKIVLNKAGYTMTNHSPIDKALAYCMENGYYDLDQIDKVVLEIEKRRWMKPCQFVPSYYRPGRDVNRGPRDDDSDAAGQRHKLKPEGKV